jgi:hypothetical protein
VIALPPSQILFFTVIHDRKIRGISNGHSGAVSKASRGRHRECLYFSNKQTVMTCLRVPMDCVEAGAGEIATTAKKVAFGT